jgi:hypothetical protein
VAASLREVLAAAGSLQLLAPKKKTKAQSCGFVFAVGFPWFERQGAAHAPSSPSSALP